METDQNQYTHSGPEPDQDNIPQTALDQMVSDDRSQILKALVPYLPAQGQRLLSVCAKTMELSRTLELFGRGRPEMQIASAPSRDPMEMLQDIRRFTCGDSRRQIDQAVSMMAVFQMLKVMNEEDPVHG